MDNLIKNILNLIINEKYEAYLVGGYVRDYIWNVKTNDVDICTNAPLNVLIDVFKDYKPKVFKYDSIKFKVNNIRFDVSQMRCETYFNNKLNVKFTDNLYLDYLRRDFTFNSLYMDYNDCIYSFGNSYDDCVNKNIRFINNSRIKIKEDGSRILRYIYFILKYNLKYNIDDLDTNIINDYFTNYQKDYLFLSYLKKIKKLNKNDDLQEILFGIKLNNNMIKTIMNLVDNN